MITFVTFHIDCAAATASHIARENVLLADRSDYISMIDLLFQSAETLHPDCRKVVVTDFSTDLSALPVGVEIHRYDMDPDTVMLSRLRGQLDFVRKHDFASDVVLLDSDVLIAANLAPMFRQRFHIGLTYRDHDDMPFNAGVMFVSRSDKAAAVSFLERTLCLYVERFAEHAVWWGDQYALAEAVGRDRLRACLSNDKNLLEVDGCSVLLQPCGVCNFSPANLWQAVFAPVRGIRVLHFKGRRKRFLHPYWRIRRMLYALRLRTPKRQRMEATVGVRLTAKENQRR